MVILGEEIQVTKCQVIQHNYTNIFFLVRGDVNFVMTSTMLTVGGFTQPAVARSMIEQPSNSEKGLSSRFLWFFPNVLYGAFDDLGQVDEEFIEKISKSLILACVSCMRMELILNVTLLINTCLSKLWLHVCLL